MPFRASLEWFLMPNILSPAASKNLREFLRGLNFTGEEFRKGPLLADWMRRRYGIPPLFLDWTREPTALNLLWRVFLIGMPVDRETFQTLVPGAVIDTMREAGMLTVGDREVAATLAESVRLVDTVARWRGDEFLIVAPGSAGMTVAQQPVSQPAQREQAGPFEQEAKPRRGQQEREVHFDFLLALLAGTPAAVCRMSLRSAGLMSDVSINCTTSS